jgi:plasmid stabilization system protein ParE
VTEFRLSARASRDVRSIVGRIAREHGSARAERYRSEIVRSIANLAEYPQLGHFRPDVTDRAVRFWVVYSHLVVYWPESTPLLVVRILHGALDPADLRDRVGEPVAQAYGSRARVPMLEQEAGARSCEQLA